MVNWDVDTGDWTGAPAAEIARRAIEGARPGAIICMHTEWNTQEAIPAIVKGLRAKGLEPVGLGELCAAAGLPSDPARAGGRAARPPAAGQRPPRSPSSSVDHRSSVADRPVSTPSLGQRL